MIRKSMPSGDEPMGGSGFPSRQTRNAFARRSCSNKKIERDDDSNKSHHALAPPTSAASGRPCATFIHKRHRPRPGDVAGLDPVNAESRTFNHCADRAVEMAATADTPPGWRQAILPAAHALIRCQPVLNEQ